MKNLFLNTLFAIAIAASLASCEMNDSVNGLTTGVLVDEHYAVDLGLDVMWATCNVGATRPEGIGTYFAWGETEKQPMTGYSWLTYKFYADSKITRYNLNPALGPVDKQTELYAGDDAATINWRGQWRMPTVEEQDQLRFQCKWTLCTINGVKGYKVTGRNSRSIFLPIAGIACEGEQYNVYGQYWSSTLDEKDSEQAYTIEFDDEAYSYGTIDRIIGASVRAVCPIQQTEFPDVYE